MNPRNEQTDLKKVFDLSRYSEVYILNQYKIIISKKLGSGSFGEIYLGQNIKTKQELAIKLELVDSKTPQLNYESKVLKFLQGGEGFPTVHFYGTVGNYNVMIIDLLGSNLEEMFAFCQKKFQLKTVLMIADQILERIEYLHSRHFIHRDIKPENFLLGQNKKKSVIYLIDFGLSKRFRDSKTGEHIPYVDGKSLTGTAVYASIYTHLGIEQSRRDDLESVGYVLMYFLRGNLPWQGIKAKTREERLTKLMEIKIDNIPDLLCKGYPEEFITYFNSVRELQFEAKPDYAFYRNLMSGCMKRFDIQNNLQFDWMETKTHLKIDLKSELSNILKKETSSINKSNNPEDTEKIEKLKLDFVVKEKEENTGEKPEEQKEKQEALIEDKLKEIKIETEQENHLTKQEC